MVHGFVVADIFPFVDTALDEDGDGIILLAKLFGFSLNDFAGAGDDDVRGFGIMF